MHLKTGGMKIALYGCVLIVSLLFSSCMKTEMKETGTKNTDKTGQTDNADSVKDTADELIDGIDMTSSRCQLRISDKFMIDAEITPYDVYKDGLGLYYFNKITAFEDIAGTEKKLVENIDARYGKDVTITSDEAFEYRRKYPKDEKNWPRINVEVSDGKDSLYFNNTYLYPEREKDADQYVSDHLQLDGLLAHYPFFSSTVSAENMEKVEKGIDAVFGMLDGIADRDKFNRTQIMYIDDTHYNAVSELHNMSGVKNPAYFNEEMLKNREKYYILRLTPGLDKDIPAERRHMLNYDKIMGDKRKDNVFQSEIDIAMTDEGEIIKFNVVDQHDIESIPYGRADIIDVREVLKRVYSRYKKAKLLYEIKVRDIYLIYSAGIEKSGGESKTCIKPYWIVDYTGSTTNGELRYTASQHIYDAVTGEYVSGVIADY